MQQVHGAQPFKSDDPDSARIWWSEVGVHQNLTFPVQPDPVSGMHCWHQRVTLEKAGPDDRYGDIFVDTDEGARGVQGVDGEDASRAGPGRAAPSALVRPSAAAGRGGVSTACDAGMNECRSTIAAPVWAIWVLDRASARCRPSAWILAGGLPPARSSWSGRRRLAGHAARARRRWRRGGSARCAERISRAGARASRDAERDRAAADAERDARHHRALGRRAARLPGARLAHRAAGAVRSRRAGAAVRGRQEFQTYTARVQTTSGGRGRGPRSSSRWSGPLLGGVVRSREPLIIDDIAERGARLPRRQRAAHVGLRLGADRAARSRRAARSAR